MNLTCGLDGCTEDVELTRRPDGRWRVRHGEDESGTTFLTASELFGTTGFWPFARTLHDEIGRARQPESMGQQAVALMSGEQR